jgi:hypothetical protein
VDEPKSVAAMIGEMLRDVAVLMLVFVPLDVFIAWHFTLSWTASILIIETTLLGCGILAAIGIWVERRRERK